MPRSFEKKKMRQSRILIGELMPAIVPSLLLVCFKGTIFASKKNMWLTEWITGCCSTVWVPWFALPGLAPVSTGSAAASWAGPPAWGCSWCWTSAMVATASSVWESASLSLAAWAARFGRARGRGVLSVVGSANRLAICLAWLTCLIERVFPLDSYYE